MLFVCGYLWLVTMQVLADDTRKPLQHRENITLRHVQELYLKFHDLAIDLRSTSGNAARASTFRDRVLTFFAPVSTCSSPGVHAQVHVHSSLV